MPIGWTRVARLEDIEPGEGACFEVEGVPVLVFRLGQGVHAMGARCAHEGGTIAPALHPGGVAVCPWHGWAYEVETGRHVFLRTVKVQTYPARARAGGIWVRVRPWRVALRRLAGRLGRPRPRPVGGCETGPEG